MHSQMTRVWATLKTESENYLRSSFAIYAIDMGSPSKNSGILKVTSGKRFLSSVNSSHSEMTCLSSCTDVLLQGHVRFSRGVRDHLPFSTCSWWADIRSRVKDVLWYSGTPAQEYTSCIRKVGFSSQYVLNFVPSDSDTFRFRAAISPVTMFVSSIDLLMICQHLRLLSRARETAKLNGSSSIPCLSSTIRLRNFDCLSLMMDLNEGIFNSNKHRSFVSPILRS